MRQLLFATLLLTCGITKADTPEEQAFISKYQHLYDAGDKSGIYGLVDWEKTPADFRASLESMFTQGVGTAKIDSVSLEKKGGHPIQGTPDFLYTFRPSMWLVVHFTGSAGGGTFNGSMQIPVGWHDGKLMIPGATPNPAAHVSPTAN